MRSRARSLAVSVGAAAIMSAAVIVAIVGQPSTALVGTTTSRIAGADRYQTAAQIATATFSHVNTVVLASGQNFPDGLAASGLAGADNAPVLLTPTAQLSSASANAIAALGAHNVIIVGGANAVSTGVQNQLTALGYTVTRIAGSDRYATAAMVAPA